MNYAPVLSVNHGKSRIQGGAESMAGKTEKISPPYVMVDIDETSTRPSASDEISIPSPLSPHESDLLNTIETRLLSRKEEPLLLMESAGDEEHCSIFRVPDRLQEVNPLAYKPRVVSIGPYHHGEKHLQMIQQHKHRFLKLFFNKAKEEGVKEKTLLNAVWSMEGAIRLSYSEDLSLLSQSDLVSIMVLDGCFILMLLLIVSRNFELGKKSKDPIFMIPWILPSLRIDLLLLENQIPLFVLQTLLETSKICLSDDLNRMAFAFFDYSSIDKPDIYWEAHRNLKAKHLLDLIRKTFVQPNMKSPDKKLSPSKGIIDLIRKSLLETLFMILMKEVKKIVFGIGTTKSSDSTSQLILSAKRLRLQGIKFRLKIDADSILDIRLEKNRLQIPLLRLDGFISSVFLNCVAFEQCSTESTNDITSYIVFMGCLLNGEEDATFLNNDKRIIENYFGNENEVSEFFKTICKGIAFDIRRSYLLDVFEGVNDYTSKWYNGTWAGFRHTHFDSPWTFMSSFAVLLVILLTTAQLVFAILSFQNDKKNSKTNTS